MANETPEPRALTAALAAPAFHTRAGGAALHAANRHVERWAPEANANRVRSMRSLSFVDRLVAPWIETAQRSASLRLFSQAQHAGVSEREGRAVSWVFPRPWYQDELDWMAASRQEAPAPTMLTTRGTYVPAPRPDAIHTAMPSALYEYVAPSLSIAAPTQSIAGIGYGGASDAYSPLVSLAAVQAAELMSRTVAPMVSTPSGTTATVGRISPALRTVLTTMLERAAAPRAGGEVAPTRSSLHAPELVTPPAPRAEETTRGPESAEQSEGMSPSQLADRYAEQRTKIVELQQIARRSAEREIAARTEESARSEPARTDEARAIAQRIEAEGRQRQTERAYQTEAQQRQTQAERIEKIERAQAAERTGARLHEQSRIEAAAHARTAAVEAALAAPAPPPAAPVYRAPAEVTAAIAALPPELAAFLAHRPERGMQAVSELNEALRTAELLARSAATNIPFEATRGPRVMMPAGLGGLVAAVDRAQLIADRPAQLAGVRPMRPMIASAAPARSDARVPTLPWLVGPSAAPRTAAASTTALGATASASPAALSHVAWADRWLARFAGATPQSLDLLQAASAGSPQQRMAALAAAAPGEVFVAPIFDTETVRTRIATPIEATPESGPRLVAPSLPPIERFDDSAETPDDVFLQIAAAASTKRQTALAAAPAPVATEPAADRYTLADAVAHAAPPAPGAGLSAQLASSPFASALRHVLPLPAAASFDIRSLFGAGLSATYLAGLLAPESRELDIAGAMSPMWASWGGADAVAAPIEREAPSFDAAYVTPDIEPAADRTGEAMEPLTTLRTALLSWTTSTEPGAQPRFDAAWISATQSASITTSAARAMIESMSLPMVGDAASSAERMASWSSPGMLAERAQGWSVAQERSASDLSLDFVTPELVLAARVYGLGPSEAAQAARLAIAGPGHMSAMAGAVDRTFVQAMAIEADRRASGGAITTAYPTSSGDVAVVDGGSPARTYASPGAAFGVERRAPRGAFLWPSATVAALGLNAASPDGQQSMPLAALELLAAQAVAEIGTYAALGERSRDDHASSMAMPIAMPTIDGRPRSESAGSESPASGEPGEADVLGAAAALVPVARRARFDALYVALSQSSMGRNWSPASRAARALALAGRGDDAPTSAYERAATAWDVLPVVYATDGMITGTTETGSPDAGGSAGRSGASSPGAPSSYAFAGGRRGAGRPGAPNDFVEPMISIDGRPGLGALSARAGEALGSYVAPAAYAPTVASSSSSSSSSSPRDSLSPAMRAPTAAQELVNTGRPAGRHGGGEVEIPTWFEAAARKMLDDRSGNTDGISLAELTLVTAAPASHVAASTRTTPSAAPIVAANGSAREPAGEPIDIEKTANDIYRAILVLMDAARARNGEPYL